MTRPSSGAHASTVHRPSAPRFWRSSGSHRVCRMFVRFSRLRKSLTCLLSQPLLSHDSEDHIGFGVVPVYLFTAPVPDRVKYFPGDDARA